MSIVGSWELVGAAEAEQMQRPRARTASLWTRSLVLRSEITKARDPSTAPTHTTDTEDLFVLSTYTVYTGELYCRWGPSETAPPYRDRISSIDRKTYWQLMWVHWRLTIVLQGNWNQGTYWTWLITGCFEQYDSSPRKPIFQRTLR